MVAARSAGPATAATGATATAATTTATLGGQVWLGHPLYRNVALQLEKEVLGRKASFGREEVESQQKSACIN